jgi:hypothetical protein
MSYNSNIFEGSQEEEKAKMDLIELESQEQQRDKRPTREETQLLLIQEYKQCKELCMRERLFAPLCIWWDKRRFKFSIPLQLSDHLTSPEIHVVYLDGQTAAQRFCPENVDHRNVKLPVVVINISPRSPGGCVTRGHFAEEEGLFRWTNLGTTLRQSRDMKLYPLNDNLLVFCPRITVIRDYKRRFLTKNERWQFNMIGVPMKYRPLLSEDKTTYLDPSEGIKALEQIESTFQFAIQNNIKVLVMTMLGCWMYNHPIHEIIRYLNISMAKYRHHFTHIIFSALGSRFFAAVNQGIERFGYQTVN